MRVFLNLLLFASSTCSFAITKPSKDFIHHEQIDALPAGWKYHSDAVGGEPLTLRIALAQSHKNFLQAAEEISDPSSSRYRKYLSVEDLELILPDTAKASESVISWLNSHAIQDYYIGRDWVEFTTGVDAAKDMLKADFASYSYMDHEPVLRTEGYSLPAVMREHIDFIFSTVHFFTPEKIAASQVQRRSRPLNGPANCSNSVCPNQLMEKYHIDYRPKDCTSGSRIGIAGFLDQFPNETDWKSFLSQYGPVKNAPVPEYNVISIRNGTTKIPPGSAFTGPLPVTFYSVGGRGVMLDQPGNKIDLHSQNEPYLEFLQHVLAQEAPPQVISISYSDDEQSVPILYARKVCGLFAQAAARGISVIGASGDGGASGTGGSTACKGPDRKRRFIPTFPSSCPWITSVGATADYGGVASYSSGGLSNYFVRPSWQNRQVSAYIQELNGTHKGLYNASGRGIPDVSLLGDGYLTLTGGFPGPHDGTSAAAPVFAAMIALINDIRLRAKKPALGFLNPLLYATKAQTTYRDVADESTSIGCADGDFFEDGWPALKGWDAATGLGEPDFQKLRKVLA